jgi:4-alpha-glucanotransferase
VVYTGTHDNETLRGWIDSILPVERKQVCEYLDVRTKDPQEIVEKMIIAAFGSVADYCIIPLQDYLGLDNSARINQPSTNGKNWKWRVNKKDLSAKLAGRIAALTALYGRMPEEN